MVIDGLRPHSMIAALLSSQVTWTHTDSSGKGFFRERTLVINDTTADSVLFNCASLDNVGTGCSVTERVLCIDKVLDNVTTAFSTTLRTLYIVKPLTSPTVNVAFAARVLSAVVILEIATVNVALTERDLYSVDSFEIETVKVAGADNVR